MLLFRNLQLVCNIFKLKYKITFCIEAFSYNCVKNVTITVFFVKFIFWYVFEQLNSSRILESNYIRLNGISFLFLKYSKYLTNN